VQFIAAKIPELFKRHAKLIVVLLLLVAWSLWYPGYRQEMTRRPLDAPITIVPPGEIRTSIHIPLEEDYELLLGFDRTGRDFAQWKALLGFGSPVDKRGIPIMVRWELYEKSKLAPLKSREVQTFGMVSTNKDYIFRMIDGVCVPPGDYEIVVKLLQEVPGITNPQGRVTMKLPPGKDGLRTPELQRISWIGLLMIEPLVWIIEAVLGILLVVRLVRGR
jgi:hypothetical protein